MIGRSVEWLNKLSPGDCVYSRSLSTYGSMNQMTVERTTKTLIVLTDGSRYRKKDGLLVGSDFCNSRYLLEATDEVLAEQKRARIRKQMLASLNSITWGSMQDEVLRNVLALVAEEKRRLKG